MKDACSRCKHIREYSYQANIGWSALYRIKDTLNSPMLSHMEIVEMVKAVLADAFRLATRDRE